MSFDLLDLAISTQPTEEYSSLPPFFGKDRWSIDPTKIVTRPSIIITAEDVNGSVENTPKIPAKRVRFASYVDVHMRCPIIDAQVHYPSKMIEELKQENALLRDDLLIAEKRVEQLESKLKRTQQALTHARTINNTLPVQMVMVLFVILFVAYKFVEMQL